MEENNVMDEVKEFAGEVRNSEADVTTDGITGILSHGAAMLGGYFGGRFSGKKKMLKQIAEAQDKTVAELQKELDEHNAKKKGSKPQKEKKPKKKLTFHKPISFEEVKEEPKTEEVKETKPEKEEVKEEEVKEAEPKATE